MLARADCARLPLAAESVDLIFCDPPYDRQNLPCYRWLAQEAMRVLKPGGFVLAIAPGYWLGPVMAEFGVFEFFWVLNIRHTGMGSMMWNKRIVVREKPLIAYSKGAGTPRCNVLSSFNGDGADKRYHHWGQDVASARYYIDCFSAPGDLVVDPFVGGGTTLVAGRLIGRRCIGFDIDPTALATTAARLAETDIYYPLPLFAELRRPQQPGADAACDYRE